jgi:serpin B
LGIENVFDSEASDFFPLTDVPGICIDKAIHNARVKIDEEGIEAAAFTAMMAAGAALIEEEADFTLDRPFVFAVRSVEGVPMFTGVVNQAG